MPAGRPSKYREEMCEIVLEAMKQGKPKEVLGAYIGVDEATIYDWINPDSPRFKPEFSKAIKQGEGYLKDWYLTRAQKIIEENSGSAAMTIFTLKNIMGWTDRQHMTGDVGHTLTVVETGVPQKDQA